MREMSGDPSGLKAGTQIDKADELSVHNRKGVGNQKEKGGGSLPSCAMTAV